MNEPLLQLLGLCRKAGSLNIGFEGAVSAIRAGRARAVLVARDLSEKTRKELLFHAEKWGAAVTPTPYDMMDMTTAVGMKTGICAITDNGFALKALSLLNSQGGHTI